MNGCSETFNYTIIANSSPVSSYSLNNDTIYLPDSIVIINSSSSATNYTWDFGDASPVGFSENPVHVYSLPGLYSITMIAYDGLCSDTSVQQVLVLPAITTDINEKEFDDLIKVVSTDNTIDISFNFNQNEDVEIDVYNSIGQQVKEKMFVTAYKNKISINVSDQLSGVYYVKIRSAEKTVIKKVLKL